MKIGFISDIHGNKDALEKVLEYCQSLDMTICCGDLIGYYDRPEETCQEIRQRKIPTVLGNHDLYVLRELNYPPEAEKLYQILWTREQLSDTSLEWLKSLSKKNLLKINGWEIRIRHASPWDMTSYLYEDSSLLAKINLPERQALVIGHTHRPYLMKKGRGMIVNCGSIGQPRSGLPGAHFVEFDTRLGIWKQLRIEYDFVSTQARLRSRGWNEDLIRKLSCPS